jgi:hypothetical protein
MAVGDLHLFDGHQTVLGVHRRRFEFDRQAVVKPVAHFAGATGITHDDLGAGQGTAANRAGRVCRRGVEPLP